MLRQTRTTLGVVALLLSAATASSSAFAFFDAEVMAGKRWYQIEGANQTSGVASQEVDVAAHIDPIPLVPISFGAKVQLGTLNPDDVKSSSNGGITSVDTAAVFTAGLDVMAWIPMVPVVTPYARLDIPLTGTMTVKGKSNTTIGTGANTATTSTDFAQTSDISGMDLGVGVKWSPLPLVRILLEFEKGMEKIKENSAKVDGNSLPVDTKSYNLASNAFLLGVEIGL